jgi:hypothetical protein
MLEMAAQVFINRAQRLKKEEEQINHKNKAPPRSLFSGRGASEKKSKRSHGILKMVGPAGFEPATKRL